MKQSVVVVAAVCMLAASAAVADTTPVMVSVWNPAQLPSCKYDVMGFRCSLLYGRCHDLTGLDVGLFQIATGDFSGIGGGGVNFTAFRLVG